MPCLYEERDAEGREARGQRAGNKIEGLLPLFWGLAFTFPSKYFATLQKGRGNFL
jgi:hypothetical protein